MHYNLQLGGEAAIMVKDRFVSAYGEPRYTVAVGGSGGAIQQYVYGQNHPGLLDAAIPQYSYPDMVTQTIHVGDCELLERWADFRVLAEGALSTWATWVNRSLIEGLNASASPSNQYAPLTPWLPTAGLDRVHQRLARPLAARAQPVVRHRSGRHGAGAADHRVDALGRPREHLRDRRHAATRACAWDNVGVQYGLQALRDGQITPAQFLDLNANVGSWKETVRDGAGGLSVRRARARRGTSTRGARAT